MIGCMRVKVEDSYLYEKPKPALIAAGPTVTITNKNGDNHEYKVTSSHVNNDKLQGPKGILKAIQNHAELNNKTIASGGKKTIKFDQLHVREIPLKRHGDYIGKLGVKPNIYLDPKADREFDIDPNPNPNSNSNSNSNSNPNPNLDLNLDLALSLSPNQKDVNTRIKKPSWFSKYFCITT
ncbi:hypothetical protein [Yersinia similis]|uniref:hypothetical protein n=1 Tax=Yersinia similis TaxID=367190 RepID=UPI0005E549FF|nr:Uncharacterised protein [Yersinia similis]